MIRTEGRKVEGGGGSITKLQDYNDYKDYKDYKDYILSQLGLNTRLSESV